METRTDYSRRNAQLRADAMYLGDTLGHKFGSWRRVRPEYPFHSTFRQMWTSKCSECGRAVFTDSHPAKINSNYPTGSDANAWPEVFGDGVEFKCLSNKQRKRRYWQRISKHK